MPYINFYPGDAALALEKRAREAGMNKAALMRKLIMEAPLADDGLHALFGKLVELGRELKNACQAGDYARMGILAKDIVAIGEKLRESDRSRNSQKDCAVKVGDFEQGEMGMITHGRAMTFRPMEQEGKLLALCEQSGFGKNAVLRALVCGEGVPDKMAWRVNSQLASLGGLIKHLSGSLPEDKRRFLLRLGVKVGDIARARLSLFKKGN